jgi:hypothetical protein
VFSRFDSLKEATKNYTIEATPDDRPSVLQQVRSFINCFCHHQHCLNLMYRVLIHGTARLFVMSVRVECLCSKGKNCCMRGKMRALVIMHH